MLLLDYNLALPSKHRAIIGVWPEIARDSPPLSPTTNRCILILAQIVVNRPLQYSAVNVSPLGGGMTRGSGNQANLNLCSVFPTQQATRLCQCVWLSKFTPPPRHLHPQIPNTCLIPHMYAKFSPSEDVPISSLSTSYPSDKNGLSVPSSSPLPITLTCTRSSTSTISTSLRHYRKCWEVCIIECECRPYIYISCIVYIPQ